MDKTKISLEKSHLEELYTESHNKPSKEHKTRNAEFDYC